MENPCSLAVNETTWWYKTNQGWYGGPIQTHHSAGEPSAVNIVIMPAYGCCNFSFRAGIVDREVESLVVPSLAPSAVCALVHLPTTLCTLLLPQSESDNLAWAFLLGSLRIALDNIPRTPPYLDRSFGNYMIRRGRCI